MTVNVVYAREPIPQGPRVFLAGPTPRRGEGVESWRPDAVAELERQWAGEVPLTILSPESRGGKRAEHYDDQVGWETDARAAAEAILFWIPRDLRTLPGFTTNVEFGLDAGTGRAVLGCPPDCPNPERNRYLIWVAERHGVPVRATLRDTVAEAVNLAMWTLVPGGYPVGTRIALDDGTGEVAGAVAQHRIKPDFPEGHQDAYLVDWDDGEGRDVWFCGCELVAAPARGGEE